MHCRNTKFASERIWVISIASLKTVTSIVPVSFHLYQWHYWSVLSLELMLRLKCTLNCIDTWRGDKHLIEREKARWWKQQLHSLTPDWAQTAGEKIKYSQFPQNLMAQWFSSPLTCSFAHYLELCEPHRLPMSSLWVWQEAALLQGQSLQPRPGEPSSPLHSPAH